MSAWIVRRIECHRSGELREENVKIANSKEEAYRYIKLLDKDAWDCEGIRVVTPMRQCDRYRVCYSAEPMVGF